MILAEVGPIPTSLLTSLLGGAGAIIAGIVTVIFARKTRAAETDSTVVGTAERVVKMLDLQLDGLVKDVLALKEQVATCERQHAECLNTVYVLTVRVRNLETSREP